MKNTIDKLMELMEADEALRGRLCEAKDKDAVIAIAAERGITLTDADCEVSEEKKRRFFRQGKQISEDELDTVGASGACVCPFVGGGGGKTDEGNVWWCNCEIIGFGNYDERIHGKGASCNCFFGGYGGPR